MSSQSVSYTSAAASSEIRTSSRLWWMLLLLAVIAVGAGLWLGLAPRMKQRAAVIAENRELAVLGVAVVSPRPGQAAEVLALPAELRPLNETTIFARANGYLKRFLVDIGTRVEEGQLLAELDAPELTRGLEGARAELGRAQAQLDLAKTTADRWAELVKTKTVSAQDNAEKQADVRLQSANVEAARANVRKLEETLDFTKILAPFRGIITTRDVDVGDLVSTDKAKPLFHLAQVRTLRAFVNVPQQMARGIHIDQKAELTLPELPGRVFEATVVRTSGALDAETRTLLTELRVDNNRDELLAGSFSQIRFPDLKAQASLTLPVNTLLIRAEGAFAAVVGKDHRVQLRALTLGRDFGNTVEVVVGVKEQEQVILNPPDAITDGAEVRIEE